MGNSYMPNADAAFSEWVNSFASYVEIHLAELGLTMADVTDLQTADGVWDTAYAAHLAAQTAAKSATAGKNEKRDSLEVVVRSVVAKIYAHGGITEEQRKAMGLVAPSAGTSDVPLGTSDDTPLAIIDISNRLKHNMRVQNKTPEGVKKARPANAVGFEVWMKIGEMPAGPEDMQYVDKVLTSQYSIEFAQADAGKQAHYAFRWVTAKGEKGNWSETESATIAA